MPDDRPLAHPEYDRAILDAHGFRAAFENGVAVEQYVAEHAHEFVLGGFLDYRYEPAAFDAYVQSIGALLIQPEAVHALRKKYLSPEQIQAAEEYRPL